MIITTSRIALVGLAVGAVFTGIACSFGGPDNDNDRSAGSSPAIDVAQNSSAESQGITISAAGAAFSGTGTFIELSASADSGPAPVRIGVLPEFFTEKSVALPPGSPGVAFPVDRQTVVRFEASKTGEQPFLGLTALDLHFADGSSETVAGDWRLALATPDDLQARLRTEQLTGPSAEDGPMRVAVEGAIRSVSETMVTVRFDSADALTQLGAPFLFSNGERLYGVAVGQNEDSRLVTYTFPPTDFGDAVEVRFGPFVKPGAEQNGSVTIDFGAIVARHGLTGEPGERAPILASDVLESSGSALEPLSLTMGFWGDNSKRWKSVQVDFVGLLGGPRGMGFTGEESFTVTRADGHEFRTTGIGGGLGADASGVPGTAPTSNISVLFDSMEEIDTPITFTYIGAPQEVVRGEWVLTLEPA